MQTTRNPGGRRAGESRSREQILTAARESFASRGFAGSTIRGIAAAAGVDPALVHHFFGTKDGLLAAALALPTDVPAALAEVLAGDHATVGHRFTRFYLGLWEDPATGEALRAMIRSAMTNEQATGLLREFISTQLLSRLGGALGGGADAELRVALASAHLVGIAFARHVLCVGPLATIDPARLTDHVAPTIQRYLTAPLP